MVQIVTRLKLKSMCKIFLNLILDYGDLFVYLQLIGFVMEESVSHLSIIAIYYE